MKHLNIILKDIATKLNLATSKEEAINTNTHYCEINLVKESGYRIVSIQFNKESKIKSVYNTCLEFIKYYNEQKKE